MIEDRKLCERHLDILCPGLKGTSMVLAIFLKHLENETSAQLEFSCKVVDGLINRARPSMGFVEDVPEHITRCIQMLSQVPGINIYPFDNFCSQVGICRTELLIFGLEIGETLATTRFKVHIQYPDDPVYVSRLLEYSDTNQNVRRFLEEAQITAGFDFYLDGRTTYRTYLAYSRPGQVKLMFIERFGPELADLMAHSSNIWLAWKTAQCDPFVYFVDPDIGSIVNKLGLQGFDYSLLDYNGISPYIFGTTLSDLKSHVAHEYNLYYPLNIGANFG